MKKQLIINTALLIVLFSCNSNKDAMKYAIPSSKDIAIQDEIVVKKNTDKIDTLKDTIKITLDNLPENDFKNAYNHIAKIVPNENIKIREKFQNQLVKIVNKVDTIKKKYKTIDNKLNIEILKCTPIILKERRDSISKTIIVRNGWTDFKKVSPKQIFELAKEVDDFMKKDIKKREKRIATLVDELKITQVSLNTTIASWMILANNFKQLFNNVMHINYFASSSAELSHENLTKTKNDLIVVFDLISNDIKKSLSGKEINSLKIKSNFYINGYSDSKKFKSNPIEGNKVLSQDRADNVKEVLLTAFNTYFEENKMAGIVFVKPEIETKGHGEEKPVKNSDGYKKEGLDDEKRRCIMVNWYFEVE